MNLSRCVACRITTILLAATMTYPHTVSADTDMNEQTMQDEIRAALQQYYAAQKAGDLEAGTTFYATNAEIRRTRCQG